MEGMPKKKESGLGAKFRAAIFGTAALGAVTAAEAADIPQGTQMDDNNHVEAHTSAPMPEIRTADGKKIEIVGTNRVTVNPTTEKVAVDPTAAERVTLNSIGTQDVVVNPTPTERVSVEPEGTATVAVNPTPAERVVVNPTN